MLRFLLGNIHWINTIGTSQWTVRVNLGQKWRESLSSSPPEMPNAQLHSWGHMSRPWGVRSAAAQEPRGRQMGTAWEPTAIVSNRQRGGGSFPPGPCHRRRAGRTLLEQALDKGPFHQGWLTGWGGGKSVGTLKARTRKSFGFFSRWDSASKHPIWALSLMPNPFQVYNLMHITMWTTSRSFKDRRIAIYGSYIACGTFNTISRNLGFTSFSGSFVMASFVLIHPPSSLLRGAQCFEHLGQEVVDLSWADFKREPKKDGISHKG